MPLFSRLLVAGFLSFVAALLPVRSSEAHLAPEAQPTAESAAKPPAALRGEDPIDWEELRSHLSEASGGLILEEIVLGRAIREELSQRGQTISPEMVDAERARLCSTLAAAAGRPESEGETLLLQVRAARGLGPVRFQALLERNAGLRSLARADAGGEISVSQEDLDEAYALKYGPRVRARLILVASESEARTAADRVRQEPFGDVAAKVSIDPSGARGGLLDPFSPRDPAYPAAVRAFVGGLKPGEVSPPIAVSWGDRQGYAILKIEEVIEPSPRPSRESSAESLRNEIRLVRERAAMDRLARRLVAASRVTVFDRSLGWSWEQRTGE